MNLLTDIIRDVATEMGTRLTKEQAINLQRTILETIVIEVGLVKQVEVRCADYPWIEKSKEPTRV